MSNRERTPRPPLVAERRGIISLPDLCRLQKVWADAGEEDLTRAAVDLSRWIGPFLQKRAFRSLWCKEESYRELTTDIPLLSVSSLTLSDMGLDLHISPQISAVTTLAGDHTTLGALHCGDVEIRAFGPQSHPLSESYGFGIYRQPDGDPLERWTACAAFPETWIEVEREFSESSYRLGLKFVGLSGERPLSFVFYLKAREAMIGTEVFKPKALRRYQGEAIPALFNQNLQIQTDSPCKTELIPLAGGGCFWDCEFLLAFEIPPTDQKISFDITSK